jgi:hypothetical protein
MGGQKQKYKFNKKYNCAFFFLSFFLLFFFFVVEMKVLGIGVRALHMLSTCFTME